VQWEECQPFWMVSHHICELRWVIHRCVIPFDYLKLVDYRPQRTQRISFAYSSVFGHQIGCLHDVTHWTRQITSVQRFTERSSATVRNRRLPQPSRHDSAMAVLWVPHCVLIILASLVSALFSKSECLESLSTQISDVMPFLSHHSRFSMRGIHLFLGCRFDGKVVARLPFPSHSCLESHTVTCPAKTSTNVL
jgi:hypothetical protein